MDVSRRPKLKTKKNQRGGFGAHLGNGDGEVGLDELLAAGGHYVVVSGREIVSRRAVAAAHGQGGVLADLLDSEQIGHVGFGLLVRLVRGVLLVDMQRTGRRRAARVLSKTLRRVVGRRKSLPGSASIHCLREAVVPVGGAQLKISIV